MVNDTTLESLVNFCLHKRATPALFQSLVKQMNHRQEISLEAVKSLISTNDELEPLLVSYFTHTTITDQTTNLNLTSVLSSLSSATDQNQYLILSSLISQLSSDNEKSLITFNTFEATNITTALFQYMNYILYQGQDNSKLGQTFGTFLIQLVPLLLPQTPTTITSEQNQLFVEFITDTKPQAPLLAEKLESLLARLTKRNSIVGSLRQSTGVTSSITSSTGYSQHSAFLKNNKVSKYIWLNSSIMNWATNKQNFLQSFEQFVNVKTNQNILNELISISLEGYIITMQSNPTNSLLSANWKLFLIKRLPLLVRQLNLKNVELSLTNALNVIDPKLSQAIKLLGGNGSDSNFDDMFSSFPSTTTDIRHDLLRGCIATSILPRSAFKIILKQDAAADSRPLPITDSIIDENGQVVDISSELSRTLINVNTEFTPLEDSGLLEFLKLIGEAQGTKQLEFSHLLISTIDTFIEEYDRSHLSRICLALGLSNDALHAVVFHLSPSALIKPVMNYLDKWQNTNDDVNFQETYNSFGCIFLLVLLVVKRFNITLNELLSYKESTSSQSFCIKFLTTIGTSKQIDTADMHKSEVLNSWISALFDSGGISDDLMRLSTVQECFEIFPIIFQQVFIGCEQKLIDIDTVKGGLGYFLQSFLLGTIVGISIWTENYLWRNHDTELITILLKTLIFPSDLSGESIHIHKVVLSICSADLYRAISNAADIQDTQFKVDEDLLSRLRQSAEEHPYPRFFQIEIPFMNKKPQNPSDDSRGDVSSFLELFDSQFQTLLNWNQSSTPPVFDILGFKSIIILLGEETIVDYFLDQIKVNSQQNAKNLSIIIDLSIYIVITHYVTFSSTNKENFINPLKTETLSHKPEDYLSGFHHLLEVLIQKRTDKKHKGLNIDDDEDVFNVFYDKIIEICQSLNT